MTNDSSKVPPLIKNPVSLAFTSLCSIPKSNELEPIKKGFDECWRVLEKHGVLIFKWSEASIKKKELLSVLEKEPLFGHPNGSRVPCHWLTFMKMGEEE